VIPERGHTGAQLAYTGGDGDQRWREMLDAIPIAVYATDADGRLTYFNQAAVALSGRVPELGSDQWCVTWKIFLPDGTELPHDRCPMALVLKGCEAPAGGEYIAERPDGTRFWFTPHPRVLRDSQGRITGGLNVLLDITDRKRAERSDLLLSAIVNSSDDAIISKDLNGIITSWNMSAQRLFGYTTEETVGRSITMLIPPDRLDEEPQILARLRHGERVDHFETIRRRKDGRLLDISLTISPVKDANGNIIGASKIARDITERKRIEAALVASERGFRQLADSMPQIVWTATPNGSVDYINQRWYEFTGFSRDVVREQGWERIVHPEDLPRCLESWRAAVASGTVYQMELRLWNRNENRWSWFIARAVPVHDDETAIVKWFGACTDIDQQKRVESDLRRANNDLEQFAYSVSHDLQEPLRGISAFSELLATRFADRLDAERLEFLNYLRSSAGRMGQLVRDLLAYTKAAESDEPLEMADANQALADALHNLAGAISETGAQITSDPLPSVYVHRAHLQQLFQNLIGNAIKYRSPERTPAIHITAEQQSGNAIFTVSDNGIGIEPEYQATIFGLFKRLHASDEYSGTGIGLAICKRIVDLYNGRIWVESEPGQGSRFRFTLS